MLYHDVESDVIKVLRVLRNNARARFLNISRDTGIKLTQVYDIYDTLSKDKIIRNVSLIDYNLLKLKKVLITISIDKNIFDYDELSYKLKNHALIDSLYVIPQGLFAVAIFSRDADYEKLLELFRNHDVTDVSVYFMVEELLCEKFLA